MTHEKLNAFGKLGRLITKRKFAVIGVWILMLAIILPVVLTASGYTSLTFNSSPETNTESGKVSQIIKDQFQNSVSNDSLILVISTDDASSIETQKFLDELVNKIKNDTGVTGVENVTSLYTILIPALNGTNQGVYLAYNNGNLTYNLLYSVPTVYSKVWEAAYNAALDQLVPGLNQTNHGAYALIPGANQTYQMLYSVPYAYTTVYSTAYNQTRDTILVPSINQTNQGVQAALYNTNMTCNLLYGPGALYLQYWGANYSVTGDVSQANGHAYQMTAATLQAVDPAAYAAYTSTILNLFNNEWVAGFSNATMAAYTPTQRAIEAQTVTTQAYIAAQNSTVQAFVMPLTNILTFENFLSYNQTTQNTVLTQFAIGMVATQGSVSTTFVSEAYALGTNPTLTQLTTQAEAILSNGTKYGMGDFHLTLSEVAYNQTATVLQAQAPTEYATYLSPLLNIYNSTWVNSFQNTTMQTYTVYQRASWATNTTNSQYITLAFSGNATAQAFATALTNAFSLNIYINNIQTNNAHLQGQLEDFAISYVADQADMSTAFIRAAYNLGTNPSSSTLTSKAKDVIWNPTGYNMGTNFVATFNQASYDNAKTILDKADHEAYVNYTSHMLNYFNASWASRVPSSASDTSWINGTAASAANEAINKFITNYLSDNQDFANGIKNTFTLQDYLNSNTTYTNAKLYNFSINYVANESGLSEDLIKSAYNLGENATLLQLRTLASDIVYDPELYNVGEQLNTAITSFVSPSNDVTLVSVTFTEKGDDNLLRIRNITQSMMAQNPDGITGVEVTGSDAISYDYMEATNSDLDLILPVTIALLVIATALFFRSVVTPIITLGTIGVGLGVSQIFPYLVGMYVNSV
ncbi:MAG TPA: MMPL family transporter, partial [Candidatus Acidoferrales bacterium]|nr:MMPL family transporter [Candidatus Acidoferrales bacterium]